MESTGYIEIRIVGTRDNRELSRDNYDIRDIIDILENAENLLYSSEKNERPIISYAIENGSVRHIFKTSIQSIIGFNALIGQVTEKQSINFLEKPTSEAFENIQKLATKNDYNFTIKTSLDNSSTMVINKTTNYYRSKPRWADSEFYFYGKITNAGGKDKANIHIVTDKLGTIRIQTPIDFLEKYNDNLLYKTFGIRATGKQDIVTGEIDTSTLNFIELVEYSPVYDKNYLQQLRDKAQKNWQGINPIDKLNEIRGRYDA